MGSESPSEDAADELAAILERENPRVSGGFLEAADRIRTDDLLHGKQTL